MAKGRFQSLGQLLPKALEGLSRRSLSEGALGPSWTLALGAPISNVSRPLALRAGVLEIEVDGEAWAKELSAREAELLKRLMGPMGGRVKRLSFRVSKRPGPGR